MQKLSFIGKPLPFESATTHFCFVGATGSGKTVSIRILLQTAFPLIGKGYGHRALVYDAKRDMIPILQGIVSPSLIKTLNPFDKRSYAWDMAKDITTPAHALQLANILIQPEQNANQPFFSDAARHLLSGVITAFICLGSDWTFRDVVLAMMNKDALIDILKSTEQTKELAELYFSHEGTAQNIMSTVATKMNPYSIIASLWHQSKKKISLEEWIEEESILVLGNEHTNRVAVDAINQAIFKRLSEIALDQDDIKQNSLKYGKKTSLTWVVFDEFVRAGKLDGMVELATEGRSKGVAIIIGFQDIEGARHIYGKEVAEEIVGQCTNIAILRLQSPETAEWASKLFGSHEKIEEELSENENESDSLGILSIIQTGTSRGTQITWRKQIKQAVLSSEFVNLPMTNMQNGLAGFLFSPYFLDENFLVQKRVSGKKLFGSLKLKSRNEGVIPRSGKEQFLSDWNIDDLFRLNLVKLLAKTNFLVNDENKQEKQQFAKLDIEEQIIFWKERRKIEIANLETQKRKRENLIRQLIQIWTIRNLNKLERAELASLTDEEREHIFLEVEKLTNNDIPYEKKPEKKGQEGFEGYDKDEYQDILR